MKIAVVGTGIAGNAAAWLLAPRHDVTVYEKEPRAGGHAHTVDIDYDGQRISVDTGFIVYNLLNYPHLDGLFRELGVETIESDMSFSVSCGGGKFEWSGKQGSFGKVVDGFFAQRRNIVNFRFLWMIREMARFNTRALEDLAAGRLEGVALGDYLEREGYARSLVDDYVIPMGAAIWSTPVDEMMRFPAKNFVTFFDNHRLVHWNRPVWRTVKGGSRVYVERMRAALGDRVRLATGVTRVTRTADGVEIVDERGGVETYDQVVLGAHSDETLAMLADAAPAERAILGAVRYRPNDVYLHRDTALMPKRGRAWSSWNFLRGGGRGVAGGEVAVSYWMNALQSIDHDYPLFVTLNPPKPPREELIFRRFNYAHPQFDAAAFDAQGRLDEIQGANRTWFCGAWTGYGFHEDGLRSAVDVAERLGAKIPWRDERPALLEAAE